jgi:hypothetical protein
LKVVCFGLGSLGWSIEIEDERYEQENRVYSAIVQHAAALTIAKVIGKRLEVGGLTVFCQNPIYNDADKRVLAEVGIQVMGGRGGLGFTYIDENTMVFSCHPNIPVKQVVADHRLYEYLRDTSHLAMTKAPSSTATPSKVSHTKNRQSFLQVIRYEWSGQFFLIRGKALVHPPEHYTLVWLCGTIVDSLEEVTQKCQSYETDLASSRRTRMGDACYTPKASITRPVPYIWANPLVAQP